MAKSLSCRAKGSFDDQGMNVGIHLVPCTFNRSSINITDVFPNRIWSEKCKIIVNKGTVRIQWGAKGVDREVCFCC